MIEKNVDISIPVLWGEERFTKNSWGFINYLVGPNGTGKTLLAEQLKDKFNGGGFQSRYLSAERLVGLEKQQVYQYGGGGLQEGFHMGQFSDLKTRAENSGLSSSAIIILKERLDIRLKIEALLSDIFNKTIRLVEEGGFLKPKMQNINAGDEYNLSQSECHGLKELITLLTFLYDPSKNCIIFDEPELHLHPQFQSFFLQEIRKIAGNPLQDPTKKMFFIITHSPYFIDLKSLDDLKNILVCHLNKVPAYVSELDEQEQYTLKRFLPRFNTHHKQFFFSPNPVFVEGYTDQQIISIIFEKLGINVGASGSCIIDVGGKDELGVFYKLCKVLKINCRIIADLDAVFKGKLREVVADDERSSRYVQEHGLGVGLGAVIGEMESHLTAIANRIIAQESDLDYINVLKAKLASIAAVDIHQKRVAMLLGLLKYTNGVQGLLDGPTTASLNMVLGRHSQLLNAFKSCNVFIFPKGEIEHYYTQTAINYLSITNKDIWFHTERDYLLSEDSVVTIQEAYSDLIQVLKQAIPVMEIEIKKHIKFEIMEWIQKIQTGVARHEIRSAEDLTRNAKINYTLYSQILDLQSLSINDNLTFTGNLIIKQSLTGAPLEVEFNEATKAHDFEI